MDRKLAPEQFADFLRIVTGEEHVDVSQLPESLIADLRLGISERIKKLFGNFGARTQSGEINSEQPFLAVLLNRLEAMINELQFVIDVRDYGTAHFDGMLRPREASCVDDQTDEGKLLLMCGYAIHAQRLENYRRTLLVGYRKEIQDLAQKISVEEPELKALKTELDSCGRTITPTLKPAKVDVLFAKVRRETDLQRSLPNDASLCERKKRIAVELEKFSLSELWNNFVQQQLVSNDEWREFFNDYIQKFVAFLKANSISLTGYDPSQELVRDTARDLLAEKIRIDQERVGIKRKPDSKSVTAIRRISRIASWLAMLGITAAGVNQVYRSCFHGDSFRPETGQAKNKGRVRESSLIRQYREGYKRVLAKTPLTLSVTATPEGTIKLTLVPHRGLEQLPHFRGITVYARGHALTNYFFDQKLRRTSKDMSGTMDQERLKEILRRGELHLALLTHDINAPELLTGIVISNSNHMYVKSETDNGAAALLGGEFYEFVAQAPVDTVLREEPEDEEQVVQEAARRRKLIETALAEDPVIIHCGLTRSDTGKDMVMITRTGSKKLYSLPFGISVYFGFGLPRPVKESDSCTIDGTSLYTLEDMRRQYRKDNGKGILGSFEVRFTAFDNPPRDYQISLPPSIVRLEITLELRAELEAVD